MTPAQSVIVDVKSLKDAVPYLDQIKKNTLVLLDVDDTLITPKSLMFRGGPANPHRLLIDEIKARKKEVKNFDQLISNWRRQRKIQLVEESWPSLLQLWQKKGAWIYGCTSLNTGPIGSIQNMEEWRFQELQQAHLGFTVRFKGKNSFHITKEEKNYACFHKGIFLTGDYTKGFLFHWILKSLNPNLVVMIDDRLNMLQDIEHIAIEKGLTFIGLHYKAAELLPGKLDEKVALFQKQYLMENMQWLEDTEAEDLLAGKTLN